MPLVKSLSALALLGTAIPSTYALSIKDDVVSLSPGIRLQTRATHAEADGATGQEYRVQSGTNNATNEPLEFMIRRARLYLNGKYGADWKFRVTFQADNVDNSATNANRAAALRYAWVERTIKQGESLTHAIHFGLDKPYNNPADFHSSSSELFPTGQVTSTLLAPRGVGLQYRLTGPMFLVAADVQNNTNTTPDVDDANAQENEGLYYGARAEISPSKEWFIAKRAESFVGKEGTGLNLGVSWATNDEARLDAGGGLPERAATTTAYGADVLFHWNMLSMYAEYRLMNTDTETVTGAAPVTDVDSDAFVIQAGWAFPLANGAAVEPAVRYSRLDQDKDADELDVVGTGDVANSGDQIDLGVNYYFDGHSNKLQLAFQMWDAEDGDANARIIRLQHQLNF
jgi:hypothetical protein